MTVDVGPKLGLFINANAGEPYFDQFRVLLRFLDQMSLGNVLNSTSTTPPTSPNNGDAYLLLGTPTGVWVGQQNTIAAWSIEISTLGTDQKTPGWEFWTPNPGWVIFDVALNSFWYYTNSGWTNSLAPSQIAGLEAALATHELIANKGQPSGYAALDPQGLVLASEIPPIAINKTYPAATQSAMLALAANVGDLALRSDLSATFILQALPPTTAANWVQLLTPVPPVLAVNGLVGYVQLASTNLTDAATLAHLSSPAFTGTPTAPTPAAVDSSTRLATTAYVKAQAQNFDPAGAAAAAIASAGTNSANASNLTSGTVAPALLPLATVTQFGVVKPDGTTIVINNGILTGIAPAPSGTVGGDLSGTLPNPTVAKINGATPGNIVTHNAADFDLAGAALAVQGTSLQKSNNLSDLASVPAARTNLGLGSAATQPSNAFDPAGAATAAATAAVTNALAAPVHITTGTPTTQGLIVQGSTAMQLTPQLRQQVFSATPITTPTQYLFPQATTSGDTILVIVGFTSANTPAPTVADSQGNTYHPIFSLPTSPNGFYAFEADLIAAGPNTVTVTPTGGDTLGSIALLEYWGLAPSAFYAGAGQQFFMGAGGTLASGAVTVTTPGDLLLFAGTGQGNLMEASGLPVISGSVQQGSAVWGTHNTLAATYQDSISFTQASVATLVGMVFAAQEGTSPQVADLQQWISPTGVVLSRVNAAGQFVLASTSGIPATAAQDGTLAFDPTTSLLYGYGAAGWTALGAVQSVNGQTGVVSLASTNLTDTATIAHLASPHLTGIPTAPTAAPGDSSTTLATTGFVAAVATQTQQQINQAVATAEAYSANASHLTSGQVNPSLLPISTTSVLGVVSPDGTSIRINTAGVLSLVGQFAPAGQVFASPPTVAGNAAMRALVASDLPTLPESQITGLVSDLAGKEIKANRNQVNGYAGLDANGLIASGAIPVINENQVLNLLSDLQLKEVTANKAQPNGYASLDANGRIPSSQIPPLAFDQTYVANSQAAMLALTPPAAGAIAVRTDVNETFILQQLPASTLANWIQLLTPGAAVQSVNGHTGTVSLASTDLSDTNQLARLQSPAFLGTPTAPTPLASDSSTTIATTAFVTSVVNSSGGTVSGSALQRSNNLSDLADASAARTNLGLGTAATSDAAAFDTAGVAVIAQQNAVASSLQKAANLQDVADVPTARTNLGLGTAAVQDVEFFDLAGAASTALSDAETFSANATNLTSGTVRPSLLPAATNSTVGVVRPDNTTIVVGTLGVISALPQTPQFTGDVTNLGQVTTLVSFNGVPIGNIVTHSAAEFDPAGAAAAAQSASEVFSGDAANLTSGTVPLSVLPVATTTSVGVVAPDGATIMVTSSGVITAIAQAPSGAVGGDLSGSLPNPSVVKINGSAPGDIVYSNIAQFDPAGAAASALTAAEAFSTNASNITIGTLPASTLPLATNTSVGGVQVDGITIVAAINPQTLDNTGIISVNQPSGSINNFLATPLLTQDIHGNPITTGQVILRPIDPADIPALNQSTTGTAAGLSTPLEVSSGGLGQATTPSDAQILVAVSASAYAPVTLSGDATITDSGAITVTSTGGHLLVASAYTDTTNAVNITTGTLAPARLPAASNSVQGAVLPDGITTVISGGKLSAIGAAPSGVAGGDLSGTYPSPAVSKIAGQVPGDIVTHNAADFQLAGTSLQMSANLSDVTNETTARANLGLGTAATQDTTAFDSSGAAAGALSTAQAAITAAAAFAADASNLTSGTVAADLSQPLVGDVTSAPVTVGVGVSATRVLSTTVANVSPAALQDFVGDVTTSSQTVGIGLSATLKTVTVVANVNPTAMPFATTTDRGAVIIDGTTIVINSGVVSAVLTGAAGGDLAGNFPNPTIATIAGVTPGDIISHNAGDFDIIGAGLTAQNNAQIYSSDASHLTSGTVSTALIPIATTSGLGLSYPDGATITINSAGVLTAIAQAPSGAVGGDLSGSLPNPTVAKVNGIVPGDIVSHNVADFDAAGAAATAASAAQSAAISAAATFSSNASNLTSGIVNFALIDTATSGVFGIVKPDGTTITVAGGILTVVPTPLPTGAQALVVATPVSSSGISSLRALVGTDLPLATSSAFGAIQPDGTTTSVTAGILSTVAPTGTANKVFATPAGATGQATLRALVGADLPAATTTVFGAVKPDGSTITINAGVISATAYALPTGAAATFVATPAGASGQASLRAIVSTDIPTLNQDTTGSAGSLSSVLAVAQGGSGSGTAPAAAQIAIAQSATSYTPQTISGDGTLSAAGVLTVTTTSGVAFAASATLDTTDAANITTGTVAIARLPVASTSTLGLVEADGSTITISPGGIITAVAGLPSGAQNQVVATPNGSTGLAALRALVPADLPVATASALGAVKPDGVTITVTSGAIAVPTATTSLLGLVKPDGSSITVTGGVISSVVTAPVALTAPSVTTVPLNVTGGFSSTPVAFVQAATGSLGATGAVAFASNNTAGNCIVVSYITGNTTAPTSVPTDTRGNSYNLVATLSSTNIIYVYVALNIAAGANTVTGHGTGGSQLIEVSEYSGVAAASAFDAQAFTTGTGTLSTSVTTAQIGDFIFATSYTDAAATVLPTGFTQRQTSGSYGLTQADLISTSTPAGSFTAIWVAGSNTGAYGIVALKNATATQTADLVDFNNHSGVLSRVNNSGQFVLPATAGLPVNTPVAGALAYNSTLGAPVFYNGSAWASIGGTTAFTGSANQVLATPDGSSGTATVRSLVSSDLPVPLTLSSPSPTTTPLTLVAASIPASPTFVQGVYSLGSNSKAFTSAVTQGNALLVVVYNDSTAISGTVSDTLGNSYSLLTSVVVSGFGTGFGIWGAFNVNGGTNTVTTSQTGGAAYSLSLLEYSGVAAASVLDGQATFTQSTSTSSTLVSVGPITTTGVNDLILSAAFMRNTGGVYTPPSGYTQRTTSTSGLAIQTADTIKATAGSVSTGWTTGASASGGMALLVVGLLRGVVTQTTDLLSFKTFGGTVLSRINAVGQTVLPSTSGPPVNLPTAGALAYNSAANQVDFFNGTVWGALATPTFPGQFTANEFVANPLATPVNGTFTTATTGGSLAASTAYFYRVAAIDAVGTTLASTQTSITTGAGSTNIVTVTWGSVSGATGYQVYGRTTGAQLLIATLASGTTLTYTDTGAVTPAGALPAANTTGAFQGSILNVTGTGTIGGKLTVAGAATVGTTLGVTGATTLSSTLAVTGATTLSSTLGVTGLATFSAQITQTGTSLATGAANVFLSTTGGTQNAQLQLANNTSGASILLYCGSTNGALNTTAIAGDNYFMYTGGSPNTGQFVIGPWRSSGGGGTRWDSSGNFVQTGTVTVSGAATLQSTLGVTGAATLSSTLGVTGLATLGSLSVSGTSGHTGAATFGSTVGVTGLATLGGLSVTGTSAHTGAATFSSTVGVTGLATLGGLSVTGTSAHTGAATFGSTLGVTGLATLASLSVTGTSSHTGAATFGSTLAVTGGTTMSGTLNVTVSGANSAQMQLVGSSGFINFYSNTGTSALNGIIQTNDSVILYSNNGGYASGALCIGPYTNVVGGGGLRLDSAGSLTVTNDVTARHLIGGGTTPTIAVGGGAGTGGTVTVTGTDTAGVITLTTGTSPGTQATMATLTFAAAYGVTPVFIFQATGGGGGYNAAALSGGSQVWVSPSTTGVVLNSGNVALAASTQYIWNYISVAP